MRVIVVEPPKPVVTWEEADQHLKLDGDTSQKSFVEGLIAAATAHIDGPDGWLGRALGVQTLEAQVDPLSRSGQLAGSIVVVSEAAGLPAGDVVYFGPSLPDGWYGGLVEDGTSRSRRHPFARPAVDGKAEEAADAVVQDLMLSLQKVIR